MLYRIYTKNQIFSLKKIAFALQFRASNWTTCSILHIREHSGWLCTRYTTWINTRNTLQWRHNVRDNASYHQPNDCLLNVYSGADQRKHQSSASLAFVLGIHRWPVNSPHKWPVTRKMFPFDDVIMSNEMWNPSPLRDHIPDLSLTITGWRFFSWQQS